MADASNINLLGKDYLTEVEAAHYACVSHSQFREHAAGFGIFPFTFMGKKVYRKVDIQRAMETVWQHSTGAGNPGCSTGRMKPGSTARPSAR
jgi:hypothetical protein